MIALEAGYRAVQSTPIISRSGVFFGVLSTHFPAPHRPSDSEMLAMRALAEITADAIIRQRIEAKGTAGCSLTSTEKVARQISRGYEAVAESYDLLRQVARRLAREQGRPDRSR